MSNISNLALKIIWEYLRSNSVRYVGCSNLVYLIYDAFFNCEYSVHCIMCEKQTFSLDFSPSFSIEGLTDFKC